MNHLRLVELADAAGLAALYAANRDFLAPYEPRRGERFYTEDGQRETLRQQLADYEQGRAVPFVILHDGAVAGRMNLSTLVRGPFQSASVGYWVDAGCGGQGLASAALAQAVDHAFAVLGLHRLEASTLLDNLRSQHVLHKNGFVHFGTAPAYLQINGAWRDHHLYQLINPRWAPPA